MLRGTGGNVGRGCCYGGGVNAQVLTGFISPAGLSSHQWQPRIYFCREVFYGEWSLPQRGGIYKVHPVFPGKAARCGKWWLRRELGAVIL
jgi:hypothetical protein